MLNTILDTPSEFSLLFNYPLPEEPTAYVFILVGGLFSAAHMSFGFEVGLGRAKCGSVVLEPDADLLQQRVYVSASRGDITVIIHQPGVTAHLPQLFQEVP